MNTGVFRPIILKLWCTFWFWCIPFINLCWSSGLYFPLCFQSTVAVPEVYIFFFQAWMIVENTIVEINFKIILKCWIELHNIRRSYMFDTAYWNYGIIYDKSASVKQIPPLICVSFFYSNTSSMWLNVLKACKDWIQYKTVYAC